MNDVNLFRLVSIGSFWLGVTLSLCFGFLFLFRGDAWGFYNEMFHTQHDETLALILAVLPFPISVVARYLSRT